MLQFVIYQQTDDTPTNEIKMETRYFSHHKLGGKNRMQAEKEGKGSERGGEWE